MDDSIFTDLINFVGFKLWLFSHQQPHVWLSGLCCISADNLPVQYILCIPPWNDSYSAAALKYLKGGRFPPCTLVFLYDFQVTLCPPLPFSVSFDIQTSLNLLFLRNSLILSFLPFPPHLSVLLIYKMTHHISTLDMFSLRSSRAACRFKNRWQSPSAHAVTCTLSSLPHTPTSVYTVRSQVLVSDT